MVFVKFKFCPLLVGLFTVHFEPGVVLIGLIHRETDKFFDINPISVLRIGYTGGCFTLL